MDYDLEYTLKEKALRALDSDNAQLFDNDAYDSTMNVYYYTLNGKGYNGAVNRNHRDDTYYTGVNFGKYSKKLVKLKTPIAIPKKKVKLLDRLDRETRTIENSFMGDNAFEDLLSLSPNDKVDRPLEKLAILTARSLPFATRSNTLQGTQLFARRPPTDYTQPFPREEANRSFRYPPTLPNPNIGSAEREAFNASLQAEIPIIYQDIYATYLHLIQEYQETGDETYDFIIKYITDEVSKISFQNDTPLAQLTKLKRIKSFVDDYADLLDTPSASAPAPAMAPAMAPAAAPAMAPAGAPFEAPTTPTPNRRKAPASASKAAVRAAASGSNDNANDPRMNALQKRHEDLLFDMREVLSKLRTGGVDERRLKAFIKDTVDGNYNAITSNTPYEQQVQLIDDTQELWGRMKPPLMKKIARSGGEASIPQAASPPAPPADLPQKEKVRINRQRGFKFEDEAKKLYTQSSLRNRYVAVRLVLDDNFPEGKIDEYVNLPLIRQRSQSQSRLITYKSDILQIIDSNRLIQNQKPKDDLIALVMRVSKNQAQAFINGDLDVRRR